MSQTWETSLWSDLSMSKARLIITAVVLEHRTQAEVAAAYGVSKSDTIASTRPAP